MSSNLSLVIVYENPVTWSSHFPKIVATVSSNQARHTSRPPIRVHPPISIRYTRQPTSPPTRRSRVSSAYLLPVSCWLPIRSSFLPKKMRQQVDMILFGGCKFKLLPLRSSFPRAARLRRWFPGVDSDSSFIREPPNPESDSLSLAVIVTRSVCM